ncbi:MAG: DHH family phosphohydrolase [Barrevirus sp.]|uniref:DHH family phosphohydrolase n=1 Tax=Barrevirus sp. TaxID=2487763 RepID=A0A3G4ZQ39_9VIRU|nr:MAG: DHH family phosphohydrolase [Barrevirus sp.]
MDQQQLTPDEVDYVIYHNPCSDGTAAGMAAWKYLKNKFPERQVIYKGMAMGQPPPDDIKGKNLLICDYSYKKDVILDLLTKVNKLLIIDHHRSAEKDLQDIDNKYKIFDMKKSGATLTWSYFFPNTEMPLLFKYIEDRDIWTKKLVNTDDFASAFYILPHDFELYEKYLDENLLLSLINVTGPKYQELNAYYTDQAVSYSVPKFCKIKGKYYLVASVNTSILKSDIGNKIFDKYPLIDFSISYSIYDSSNTTSISLRSTDKHADVSKIATKFGAGGHRNASGMRLEYISNAIPSKSYDHGEIYNYLENVYFGSLTIDNQIINIIYLHTTLYQFQLGKYFLQTKYKTQNKERVQVGSTLNNSGNPTDYLDMSAMWNYNVKYDTSDYIIIFDKKLDSKTKEQFINQFTNKASVLVEFNNPTSVKLTFSGLVKKIIL